MKIRYAMLVVLAILAIACGKKDDKGSDKGGDKGTAAGTGDKADNKAPPPAEAPDFSMWKGDEKMKAWEGSWLVKDNGTIQAWTVAGTKVTTWDGDKEESFTLEMVAPCRAQFKNDKGMMFPRNFTVVDGQLRYRSWGAGYREGDKAIYCDASRRIYVLDGDKCVTWEDKFGKWEKADAECGIKKNDDGAEVFHHGDPNAGEFPIEGGAIVPESKFETEKVEGDHEAAKKARDARAAEK